MSVAGYYCIMILRVTSGGKVTFRGIIGLYHFVPKRKIAECKVQNVKVKMRVNNSMTCSHTSILQLEIYILHFELAEANGRAMKRSGNGSKRGDD